MKYIKILAIIFFDLIDKYIHQKRIILFFRKKFKKIECMIDVGCHKGTYSDLFINNFNLKIVLMFEPQRAIFSFLKKKYRNFQNVKLFNNAVSKNNKSKKIYINRHDLTSSLKKLDENNSYIKQKKKLFIEKKNQSIISTSYLVKCVTLTEILKKFRLNKVDLLKIDTEGYEHEVLNGIGKNIKKINYILIEFHNDKIYSGYNPLKIHKFLEDNNFFLKKILKFPFTAWEDRIYINKNFK